MLLVHILNTIMMYNRGVYGNIHMLIWMVLFFTMRLWILNEDLFLHAFSDSILNLVLKKGSILNLNLAQSLSIVYEFYAARIMHY